MNTLALDPPRTDSIQLVGSAWCAVLGRQKLALTDDFFELGGDSVLMLTVIFQIGQRLGLEVSPAMMLEHSTLGGFSKAIDTLLAKSSPPMNGSQNQSIKG